MNCIFICPNWKLYLQALFCWDTQRQAEANAITNYHSSLDAPSIASKKNYTEFFFISNEQPPKTSGVAAVQIWLVLFVFFESGKLWSCEGAERTWRADVREKNANTSFARTLFIVFKGKGKGYSHKSGESCTIFSHLRLEELCSDCSIQFVQTDTFSWDKIPIGTKLFSENLFCFSLRKVFPPS